MADDVGGKPFPDGEEPEYHHGAADDAFASVVFDEAFVRAAEYHEPTAVERILAAAQSHAERAESETLPAYDDAPAYRRGAETDFESEYEGEPGDEDLYPYSYENGQVHEHGSDFGYRYGSEEGVPRPYRGHIRWQRPVAWVLAVVMGIGMVALAFSAVYRGAAGQREEPSPPPATTGVGSSPAEGERSGEPSEPPVLTEP